MTSPLRIHERAAKRKKAQPRKIANPILFTVEVKHELEARIFKLEERVKFLENHDTARGLSGMLIGGNQ